MPVKTAKAPESPGADGPDNSHRIGNTIRVHETQIFHDAKRLKLAASLAIGQNGDIYYAATGEDNGGVGTRIFALNSEDGSMRWKTGELDNPRGIASQIVVGNDGRIYVIGWSTVYAFSPKDGTTLWTWKPKIKKGLVHLTLNGRGDVMFGHTAGGAYQRHTF